MKNPLHENNRLIIWGLLVIAGILWVGIMVLICNGLTVPTEITMAASNITAGLVGFLGAQSRGHTETGAAVENAENVNVTAPKQDPPNSLPENTASGDSSDSGDSELTDNRKENTHGS